MANTLPRKTSLTGLEDLVIIDTDVTKKAAASSIFAISKILDIPIEYGNNPIYALNDPLASAQRSILYFPAGFNVGNLGTSYKYVMLWVNDNVNTLKVSGSDDFKSWTYIADLVGVISGNHPCIVQVGSSFRLFYMDAVTLYAINGLRTATSTDLLNFTSDQPLQNDPTYPMVTGAGTGWNRGSYGISSVIYNSSATNTGSDPRDYSYLVYVDATDGAFESIAIGYSVDGITFALYGASPVLDHPSSVWGRLTPWDSSYVTWPQVIKLSSDEYLMFYCGGITNVLGGVGVAFSVDGLSWTKLTENAPIIAPQHGTWLDTIATFPSIVADLTNRFSGAGDLTDIKMMITGGDAPNWNYTNGIYNISNLRLAQDFALYRTNLSESATGPIGPTGATGIQGPTGPTGATGADGQLDNTFFTVDTDPFGRKRLLFKIDNNVIKLGEFTADGDAANTHSEGIVVVGANSQSNFDQANYAYARIKPNRIGLFDTISGNQVYIFRIDSTDFFLKDDSGNSTFTFDRSTGNLAVTGTFKATGQSGATRPASPISGQEFFDTNLTPARPIWYNGTIWVDSAGLAV